MGLFFPTSVAYYWFAETFKFSVSENDVNNSTWTKWEMERHKKTLANTDKPRLCAPYIETAWTPRCMCPVLSVNYIFRFVDWLIAQFVQTIDIYVGLRRKMVQLIWLPCHAYGQPREQEREVKSTVPLFFSALHMNVHQAIFRWVNDRTTSLINTANNCTSNTYGLNLRIWGQFFFPPPATIMSITQKPRMKSLSFVLNLFCFYEISSYIIFDRLWILLKLRNVNGCWE